MAEAVGWLKRALEVEPGSSDAWCALPASAQLWATCAWTCLSVTAVLLPPARSYTQQIGFMPSAGGDGDGGAQRQHATPSARAAFAAAGVPLAYAVSVGVGTALSIAVGVG